MKNLKPHLENVGVMLRLALSTLDPYEVGFKIGPDIAAVKMLPGERMEECYVEPMYEVVVMMFIGIDVHKVFCHVCIKDKNGLILGQMKLPNNRSGADRLLNLVDGRPAKAVVESTGNHWIRLYERLEQDGVEVLLSNPFKTKAIAEARLKSDKVDASTHADLLRANLVAQCYVPPSSVREVREVLRVRMNLVRDCTRVKNRVRALLAKHEIPRFKETRMFGKVGMIWLKGLELPETDHFILHTCTKQLEFLNELVKDLERSIALVAVNNEDCQLLMTIPGMDFYTALMFSSEVGDIERFPSANKLVSWLGLAPRVRQSGNVCYHGHITKMGSPRVRGTLTQAAHIAVRHDSHFRSKYERISLRRGKSKAIVAVAREL
ncbi:MAG: IS110 family transposase, partial [Candidatus Thorarchaeota archaeon]|nr:IS110 family transposase [Candidatus Thorarchaeota archaeon]